MVSREVFLGADREPRFFSQEVDLPRPNDEEILAKVSLATVCESDTRAIFGRTQLLNYSPQPRVLGHEAVLEVIQSKRTSHDFKPGDRIVFASSDSCSRCLMCHNKLPQQCPKLRRYGNLPLTENSGLNGCFSTHILLSADTHVCLVPSELSDREAAPINCALARMVHALSCIPDDGNFSTAIIHDTGLCGIYASVLLKERGFSQIYCTGAERDKLMLASRFGATPFHPDLPQFGQKLEEGSVDAIIHVSGTGDGVTDELKYIRPGGVIVYVGGERTITSPWHIPGNTIVHNCLTVKGIQGYLPHHLEQAVQFMTKIHKKYPFEGLVSPEHSLQEFNNAVQLAEAGLFHRVAIKP